MLAATIMRIKVDGGQLNAMDLATAQLPFNYEARYDLSDGTGANQGKTIWSDERTLAASASENMDFSGGLTDAFGNSIVFTKLKALIIKADSGNTNDLKVGGAAANPIVGGPFGVDGSQVVAIKPGDSMTLFSASAAGCLAIAAGTADILKVLNGGSGTGVTYEIVAVGA